jgi:hypothetical protein
VIVLSCWFVFASNHTYCPFVVVWTKLYLSTFQKKRKIRVLSYV